MPNLTKDDIKALRSCDRISIHLSKHSPNGRVVAIKEERSKESVFSSSTRECEREIAAHVTIHTMHDANDIKCGIISCFDLLYNYRHQHTQVSSVLKTLREGDEITFRFYPDAHTNGYVAAQSLHADALYLDVKRDGKTVATWELATQICPNNSARMVQGVRAPDWYYSSAEQARKVA